MTVSVSNTIKARPVVWSTTYFLGGPPHCYQDARQEPGSWILAGDFDGKPCRKWREHRGERGITGFLRFIRALPEHIEHEMYEREDGAERRLLNPFISDEATEDDKHRTTALWICYEGQLTESNRLVYAEVYLLADETGFNPVYKVFLDRERKEAVIECYDERYTKVSVYAAASVEMEYQHEEETGERKDLEAQRDSYITARMGGEEDENIHDAYASEWAVDFPSEAARLDDLQEAGR